LPDRRARRADYTPRAIAINSPKHGAKQRGEGGGHEAMNEIDKMTPEMLKLPPRIVTKVDVSHLLSDVVRIDSGLISREAKLKAGVQPSGKIRCSEQLTAFLSSNGLEISLDSVKRSYLISKLRHL